MTMMSLLDISTGHLCLKTRDWLDDHVKAEVEELPGRPLRGWLETVPESGVVCMPFRYGWFLHVKEEEQQDGTLADDLQAVLNYASRQGFDWIKLDADGERYDELPFYEDE